MSSVNIKFVFYEWVNFINLKLVNEGTKKYSKNLLLIPLYVDITLVVVMAKIFRRVLSVNDHTLCSNVTIRKKIFLVIIHRLTITDVQSYLNYRTKTSTKQYKTSYTSHF